MKQRWGYCSIIFSVVQAIILVIMMGQCGIAPINVNPMIGPYPDALSEWGGKIAVNILVTPILLHAGVIHLFCNVAMQLETGAFFEQEWGNASWLCIYLVSAVGSSICSVIAMPNSVSVGSSGAVMGLSGGKLSEVFCRCCERTKTDQDQIGTTFARSSSWLVCALSLLWRSFDIHRSAYYYVTRHAHNSI